MRDGGDDGGAAATDGPERFISIAAYHFYTCALSSRGRVVCWGATTRVSFCSPPDCVTTPPTLIDGPTDAVDIAVGHEHACALSTAGDVSCWGNNAQGAVGPFPLEVTPASPVPLPLAATAIGAGGGFSCATLVDGTTHCWGLTPTFHLNMGGNLADFAMPTAVDALSPAVEVAGAFEHACVRLESGAVQCWGNSRWSKLGAGEPVVMNDFRSPITVTGIDDATRLLSVPNRNCVIRPTGALLCWGQNVERRPEVPGMDVDDATPVAVAAGEAFSDLSLGSDHSCGITLDGHLLCWGNNEQGQLGHGDTTAQLDPQQASVSDAIAIASGGSHACAVVASGKVFCWGNNSAQQLGTGLVEFSATPVEIDFAF